MAATHSELSVGPSQPAAGCLFRVFWMILGNLAVGIVGLKIAVDQSPFFSILDLFFWSLALAVVVIRFVDIRWLSGMTARSEPATLRDWRNYALIFLAVCIVGWCAVHGLNYLRTI